MSKDLDKLIDKLDNLVQRLEKALEVAEPLEESKSSKTEKTEMEKNTKIWVIVDGKEVKGVFKKMKDDKVVVKLKDSSRKDFNTLVTVKVKDVKLRI
jgi:hypothetical protein